MAKTKPYFFAVNVAGHQISAIMDMLRYDGVTVIESLGTINAPTMPKADWWVLRHEEHGPTVARWRSFHIGIAGEHGQPIITRDLYELHDRMRAAGHLQ